MKKVAITAITGKKGQPNYKELPGEAKQYESVAEAIKDVKEEKVLAFLNSQIRTDALNALRNSLQPPSEGSLGRLVGKAPKKAQDEIDAILIKYGVKKAA